MKQPFLLFTALVFAITFYGCTPSTEVPQTNPDEKYFAPPADLSEVVASEKQKFVIDTLITELDMPWAMDFLPNGKILITERTGQMRLVVNGELKDTPIAGVPSVLYKRQGGLLDVELHPDYETNKWVYLSYSVLGEDSTTFTTLVRAKLENDSVLVNHETLFDVGQENYTNKGQHFGGRIVFDKDNYMFLSVGDRGDRIRAQHLSTYNGKMYRFKDDGSIPEDNPFVNMDTVASKGIYSYGHRNPQGLVINPATGELFEHEHGPKGGDEVNIIETGKNYGWPVISYGINYNGTIFTEDTVREGMEQPLHFWRPSIAPCGMDFVSSDKYPNWKGNLLVGSLKFRYVARCEMEGGKIVHEEKLLEPLGRMRSVEQGPDGFIYALMEAPGQLVRIYPVSDSTATEAPEMAEK